MVVAVHEGRRTVSRFLHALSARGHRRGPPAMVRCETVGRAARIDPVRSAAAAVASATIISCQLYNFTSKSWEKATARILLTTVWLTMASSKSMKRIHKMFSANGNDDEKRFHFSSVGSVVEWTVFLRVRLVREKRTDR